MADQDFTSERAGLLSLSLPPLRLWLGDSEGGKVGIGITLGHWGTYEVCMHR